MCSGEATQVHISEQSVVMYKSSGIRVSSSLYNGGRA